MNNNILKLLEKAGMAGNSPTKITPEKIDMFAKLLIEETLAQVDEQCYGRGENQWYYEADKRWIRMHFDGNKDHITKDRRECNEL